MAVLRGRSLRGEAESALDEGGDYLGLRDGFVIMSVQPVRVGRQGLFTPGWHQLVARQMASSMHPLAV